jgi:fatty-acyl-CoA synthase
MAAIYQEASTPYCLSRGSIHENAEEAARRWPEMTFAWPDSGQRATISELLDQSRRAAEGLQDIASVAGQRMPRIALLFNNDPDVLVAFFAVLRVGAAAVPLPLGASTTAERIRELLAVAGCTTVITTASLAAMFRSLQLAESGVTLLTVERLLNHHGAGSVDAIVGLDTDAVVQFTSGSTSAPKGVLLTHGNVITSIGAMARGADLKPAETLGLWIPLFHDMGLFSTLTGIVAGLDIVMWPPGAFIKSPRRWLAEFSAHKVNVCPLPNFAYDTLCREVPPTVIAETDLSHWRVALNGAEPIDHASIQGFIATFAPAGFAPEAMMPVYGLAEATLAVSFPLVGQGPQTMWVDGEQLRVSGRVTSIDQGENVRARPIVCVGNAVEGMEIQIRGQEAPDVRLPPWRVGLVYIRGPAVTRGYLTSPHTIEHVADELSWVSTGDLGFIDDRSDLYITGRAKELIIIRGQNYYPEDVERAIRGRPEVYKGRCVAFADDATNAITVVAETTATDIAEARKALRNNISVHTGITQAKVILVSPRSIPRTTSGKLQRLKTKALLARQALEER